MKRQQAFIASATSTGALITALNAILVLQSADAIAATHFAQSSDGTDTTYSCLVLGYVNL